MRIDRCRLRSRYRRPVNRTRRQAGYHTRSLPARGCPRTFRPRCRCLGHRNRHSAGHHIRCPRARSCLRTLRHRCRCLGHRIHKSADFRIPCRLGPADALPYLLRGRRCPRCTRFHRRSRSGRRYRDRSSRAFHRREAYIRIGGVRDCRGPPCNTGRWSRRSRCRSGKGCRRSDRCRSGPGQNNSPWGRSPGR